MDNDNNVFDFEKLKEIKAKKRLLQKSEKVIEDLNLILYILNLTISGLSNFTKYVFVTECISVIQNNKILLEVHLNKYKKALERIKEEMKDVKLEKDAKDDPK